MTVDQQSFYIWQQQNHRQEKVNERLVPAIASLSAATLAAMLSRRVSKEMTNK
jgi:hypothetical protein